MFKGMIAPFVGAKNEIPAQWFICDGTNGTPDLRGRTPVGEVLPAAWNKDFANALGYSLRGGLFFEDLPANPFILNNTGGEARHRLTTAEMPAHTHTCDRHTGSHHSGNSSVVVGQAAAGDTGVAGSSAPHANLPPFTVVIFIMYNPEIAWTQYT